jgi:hypothetical protein
MPEDKINDADGSAATLSPMHVLDAARKAVPAVDYALGAAGVAAAGAIIVSFLGNGRGAVIVLSGMLVAMILLFVFARLLAAKNKATTQAALALMWMVVVFFGIFLAFTVTAIAFKVPLGWVQVLGLEDPVPVFDRKAMEKLLEVPKEISTRSLKGNLGQSIRLVRLQPRDAASIAQRETVMRGGGAYFSFVTGSHEYGQGSDIELHQGKLRVGFAGADYGFFLNVGTEAVDELAKFEADPPPKTLEQSRNEAWDYMWTYRPPVEIKSIRKEQRKSDGFSVGGATLSRTATATKGNTYLLRSISIGDSDVLVGFVVVDILDDNSIVLAWRILKTFDTPIATGTEE